MNFELESLYYSSRKWVFIYRNYDQFRKAFSGTLKSSKRSSFFLSQSPKDCFVSKRECEIKKMSRKQKLEMIEKCFNK